MKNPSFHFRGITMTVRVATAETLGAYALIEVIHPPSMGPALHIHPRGPEAFIVMEGEYTFTRGDETVHARPGDSVIVPQGVPHRYRVSSSGGRALVICPPGLESYFLTMSDLLRSGGVSFERESEIASQFGQNVLDGHGHWNIQQAQGHVHLTGTASDTDHVAD